MRGGRRELSLLADTDYLPDILLHIILKKGREVPILRGHPWIFSGAIDEVEGNGEPVGVADVFDWEKHWIARGLVSLKSQIRVRVLTWKKEEIDSDFFFRRLSRAIAIRERVLSEVTNAYRVVNGEGDLLPGLIVDRYDEFLVFQLFTAALDAFKPLIVDSLSRLLSVKGIFEKSEGRVRDEEGIAASVGVVAGEPPPN